jgi:transcriptional regulator with XRE-family HTH domain
MNGGEAIFRSRMRAGLSRKEVADKSGIRVGRLGEYENGKANPGVAKLMDVACALEISFAELTSDDYAVVIGSGPLCRKPLTGSEKKLPESVEAMRELIGGLK